MEYITKHETKLQGQFGILLTRDAQDCIQNMDLRNIMILVCTNYRFIYKMKVKAAGKVAFAIFLLMALELELVKTASLIGWYR